MAAVGRRKTYFMKGPWFQQFNPPANLTATGGFVLTRTDRQVITIRGVSPLPFQAWRGGGWPRLVAPELLGAEYR